MKAICYNKVDLNVFFGDGAVGMRNMFAIKGNIAVSVSVWDGQCRRLP